MTDDCDFDVMMHLINHTDSTTRAANLIHLDSLYAYCVTGSHFSGYIFLLARNRLVSSSPRRGPCTFELTMSETVRLHAILTCLILRNWLLIVQTELAEYTQICKLLLPVKNCNKLLLL